MTTRDEARAKCIEKIARTLAALYGGNADLWEDFEEEATMCLDSLHGTATVNLPEATEEMIKACRGALKAQHDSMSPEEITALWPRRRVKGHGHRFPESMKAKARWRAMSARGNLTNGPEKKL